MKISKSISDRWPYVIGIILWLVAIYFPIFLHLDYVGLYRWDEATNAMNALEMSENGNYLRRFFLGRPDTWETKPPFLTWLQVICFKIFGYNELSIRFPSAFAALGTVLIIARFFAKELKFLVGGLIAGLVLLTSSGYVKGHVTRTGDHDALLIFFLVAGLIYFYKYIQHSESKWKNLIIFICALTCGVLTKSIAGFYFAPAILLFTIYQGKFFEVIRDKKFWLGILIFFLVLFSYYGLNEIYYPGYLKLIWDNELFPRFFNTASNYDYRAMPEPWFFTKTLFSTTFKYYMPWIGICLLLIFRTSNHDLKSFTILICITALLFHLIISKGTFNNWYDAPIYPLLSIIVGAGFGIIYQAIIKQYEKNLILDSLVTVFFFVGIFMLPYQQIIINECYLPKHYGNEMKYGDFLKKLRKEQPDWKDIFVFYEPLNAHFLFYEQVYNRDHNYRIRSCGPGRGARNCPPDKRPGTEEKIMVCKPELREELHELYELKEVKYFEGCHLYEMVGVRDSIWFTEAPR